MAGCEEKMALILGLKELAKQTVIAEIKQKLNKILAYFI